MMTNRIGDFFFSNMRIFLYKRILLLGLLVFSAVVVSYCLYNRYKIPEHYIEKCRPTPNVGAGVNPVEGIVLHHTASSNLKSVLFTLRQPESNVSSHVVIAKNGTRYILADPEQITWHAGRSALNGKIGCNEFTVGIEFLGNTEERPLTKRQIASAIEYIYPLVEKYKIPLENIITHQMVREEWIKSMNDTLCPKKNDIVQCEYLRFMNELRKKLKKGKG